MPTAHTLGTGQFIKCEFGGSEIKLMNEVEAMSGSIDSMGLKTDTNVKQRK